MDLKKGQKMLKHDLKWQIYGTNVNRKNANQMINILNRAGYIELKGGRVVRVKRNINL